MMFKLFSSKVFSSKNFNLNTNRKQYLQVRLNFNFRDILQPVHGESGSLIFRFIKHIALERCKINNIVPKKIKYSQFYPVSNEVAFQKLLKITEISQLPQVTVFTSTYKSNADPSNVARVITSIDNMCCAHLCQMSLDEIYHNLYSFMYLLPNKITKFKFYALSITRAIEVFDSSKSKQDFVQLCFYLGLSKNKNNVSKYMKQFLAEFSDIYLNQLNTIDFAIVVSAAFKCSLPFEKKEYVHRLLLEIMKENIDQELLITFIKSLRLNRIKSDNVIKLLGLIISKESDQLDFKALTHIFAYFAENNFNETTKCTNLAILGIKKLNSLNLNNFEFNDVRPKDLATFLWSCSFLKLDVLKKDDFIYFENIIIKKINRNEYIKCIDELVDTCLSLWMLNYRSTKLIAETIKIRQFLKETGKINEERNKLESRFKLLINLVQIEGIGLTLPKYLISNPFNEKRIAPDFIFKHNENLIRLFEMISEKRNVWKNIKDLLIVQPILSLNTASLLLEYNEYDKIFLEIVDKNNKLRFNNEPNSITSLKVNTLQNINQKVICIDMDLAENMILKQIEDIIDAKNSDSDII